MLGKLLKHEFRATGRTMLPVLGVLTVLVVLANISVRMLDAQLGSFLTVLFVLLLVLAFIAIVAAEIMPVVMMVQRFYKNLLGSEGYLMHTLPANVHELVWSKLIVSTVWLLGTNLVIFLLGGLSVLHLGELSLGEILQELPSSAEIKEALAYAGIGSGDITLLMVEMAVMVVLVQLVACLHFYAAMALGHMFSKNKGLLSVVFFVVLSYLFSTLTSLLGVSQADSLEMIHLDTALESLRFVQAVLGESIGVTLVQGAVFYIATVLGLKKGLNLA